MAAVLLGTAVVAYSAAVFVPENGNGCLRRKSDKTLSVAMRLFLNMASLSVAEEVLTAAQANPEGRARIALVAALIYLSVWIDPFSPEPGSTDYATQ